MLHVSETVIKDRYNALIVLLAENIGSESERSEWYRIRKEKAKVYAELLGRSLAIDLADRLER